MRVKYLSVQFSETLQSTQAQAGRLRHSRRNGNLTRMIWSDYPGGNTNTPKGYTQVVVDMIDGVNDFTNFGRTSLSEDNVTGYNIRQIEDALVGQRTWVDWRNNIQNRYNNGTENNLESLFDYWN